MKPQKTMFPADADSGAEFSEDRKYRFCLFRIWDRKLPLVMFIGLNPSTANETDNDPTIKSVCRIAKNNGFGGAYMMNCFPLISIYPNVLKDFWGSGNPYKQNQDTINRQKLKAVSEQCEAVVFAWGSFSVVKDVGRDKELSEMFPNAMALFINKNGSPKHPLYCKSETKIIKFKNNLS